MLRAGLYLRVSTEAQTEKYSIDAQEEMLNKYCDIKGYIERKTYTDAGFSGSNTLRPALDELINDCKRKIIDVVIVYKLDRLSRSQKDTLYLIEEVFIPNDVGFISVSENFDTSSPFGKAMIGILSVFAQLERETIRERTRMGMRERVKKGYWPGGGKSPFGYDYIPEKGMLIPNSNAPIVKKMYEMYLSGNSAKEIADRFGIKYDNSVTQILKCKINMGYIEHNKSLYKGLHEPIVSPDVFHKTEQLMKQRSRNGIKGNKNLLTGLVYCGVCGAKMRYQKWGKNGHRICCYSQQSDKEYLIKDRNCDNKKHWAFEIEDAVVEELRQFSLDPNLMKAKTKNDKEDERNQLSLQINTLNKKIDRLLELISDGIAQHDAKEKLKVLYNKRNKLYKLSEDLNKVVEQKNVISEQIKNLDVVWDSLDFNRKRAIILLLVKKITVKYDVIDVYYNIE